MEQFQLVAKDGTTINGYFWVPEKTPKAVIQVAHGMTEHSKRYEEFAIYMVDQGFAVYANDHRGHGMLAAQKGELGFFAEENGWNLVINDMEEVTNFIAEKHHNIPIILLGHSMGSFLARTYLLENFKNISGLIISGTGGNPGLLGRLGIEIAKFEMRRKGKKAKSELITNMAFGSYNKAYKNPRTKYEWLSSDEDKVDNYINDPFCGQVCTTSFYYDLFRGMNNLFKKEHYGNIPTSVPILIFSGTNDPLGKNGKVVKELYKKYKKAGVIDVQYKVYEYGRHEMLNESNRYEVFESIFYWVNNAVVNSTVK
jgi:alpha-beta hydrolase superfamily lysophospholipase